MIHGKHGARSAGFNLLEMMIVLAIVGVLASFAIPSFSDMLQNNRRTVVVNDLLSSLLLARGEASKRGQSVSVCGMASDGASTCNGGKTWDYGWVVFVDVNANGVVDSAPTVDGVTYDERTLVLRRYVNASYPDIKVRSSTTAGPVILQPFNQGSVSAAYLLVCDKRGNAKSRRVCVEKNGRPSSSETACDASDTQTCP